MTHRLTKEFKLQSTQFMLETSKQLILTNFDKNDKCDKIIEVVNDTSTIKIIRSCFKEPYFEDYLVSFSTIIQNQKIYSQFFLEWKNNDMNSELILANTVLNPRTGLFSKRALKIKKCS